VTPPAASDPATDRRTVGDILLARGYISEAQLEHAVASQQASGKPLGQVLVEAGAITRLELASALAEQWSDTATWFGPPESVPARSGKSRAKHEDALAVEGREAGYAQQLQEAVVELARRVASFEPVLTDLKLRFESGETDGGHHVLDRVEVVQEGVGVVSRRLDELTDGIERALTSIDETSKDLAGEIDELSARVDATPGTAALEELRATIEALAGRPAGDPSVAPALEALTARVDELAAAVASREAVDARAAAVEDLASRVDELQQSIAARAESAALDELRGSVGGLQQSVDELTARPQADPGLATRLEELTSRIEALAGTDALEAVQAAIDEIAGRPTADPELDGRLNELANRVDEAFAAVESRASADGLEGLREQLAVLGDRHGSFAAVDDLAALRAVVDELAAQPREAPELLDQLAELARRIEALAAEGGSGSVLELDTLRGQVEELLARPAVTEADPELDRRLDHLVSRLDALHARVEEVAAHGESAADAAALEGLRLIVSEVAERPTVDPELATTVETIAARVEELAVVDVVASRLDEMTERIRHIEEADGSGEATARLGDLRATLETQVADVARQASSAVETWAADRSSLEARLEELAREISDAKLAMLAPAPAPAAEAPPAPKSKKAVAAAADEPMGVEGELERLRMAVERINMHLGERERAISDLMRSRAQEVKLEELVARIAELEQGGHTSAAKGASESTPAAGGGELHVELRTLAQRLEDAEKAAKTDREKVLTQLERMASSIDWRFRRLEGGEESAA
jgi:hypothetical protein